MSTDNVQCLDKSQTETWATGETSQRAEVREVQSDESPGETSGNEGTSPSDQETEFEDVSEGEANMHEIYYNSHSNSCCNNGGHLRKDKPPRRKIFRRRQRRGKVRKALAKMRSALEGALQGNYLSGFAHLMFLEEDDPKGSREQNLKDITLWGVPLLPSKGHEGTDIILLKFLKAQGYRVSDALEMLRQTLIWRKKQGIDHILEENIEDQNELDKVVFIDSVDKDGHPLCFNLYGAFRDKALYNKTFGTETNRREFLRWRVQFMEKSIKKLSFKAGGVDSFLLISDMKNAPGPGNRIKELGPISKDAVWLFQHYYPELISKHIIINTPFWYYLYHGLVTQYCTQGTSKKFVFARPYRVTETLLKYIPPQNIPIQYGGLRRENDKEFTSEDEVLEFSLRGGAVSTFQIPVSEGKLTLIWEVMVVGWDVTYKDEFIPDDEGSYKILLQKEKKIEESIRNSFYIHEPGKIFITIKNANYIRKKVFIRHKAKVTLPVYMSTKDQS